MEKNIWKILCIEQIVIAKWDKNVENYCAKTYVLATYLKMQYIANTFTEPHGKLLEMFSKNLIIMANNQVFLSDDNNNLNQLLSTFVDSEHEIKHFCSSQYIDLSDLKNNLEKMMMVLPYLRSMCKALMQNLTTFLQ